jgi:WD40 repeat protein
LLAAGYSDWVIQIWNLERAIGVREFKGHTRIILCMAFTGDTKSLISASEDCTIRIWDVATGAAQVLVGHEDLFTLVGLSSDEMKLASVSTDCRVKIWNFSQLRSLLPMEPTLSK